MKRIIIVTGASSGMGTEFARQLARKPAIDELWLIARRKDRLRELAAELENAGSAVRVFDMDIAGAAGYGRFLALLEREAERCPDGLTVDTLVNNAGFGTYGPFVQTPLEKQLEMIELNVTALTGLCGAVLPFMTGGCSVVNVSSLAAFIPLGNFAVYGATKAYVLSYTLALAAEVADSGIRVLAVCPGPVDTEFADVASNGARTRVLHGKSAESVVRHALRALERGRRTAIMAWKWKCKAFMSRFVGRYFFARYTYLFEKRPRAD